jgi:hypothetical protein
MSSRGIGAFLIGAACIVAFALGLEAKSAEPERIEDLQSPAIAMTVDTDADGNLVAIRVFDPDLNLIAVLRADGTVETDKEPEVAAKAFWYALSGYIRQCSKL